LPGVNSTSYGLCHARLNDGGAKVRKLIFPAIGLLFLYGCVTTSFQSFHETVNLEGLTIHIVSSTEDFPHPKFKGSPILQGYANGFEVWVVGCIKNGEIYIDSWLLGHEIRHTLKARYAKFSNPDEDLGIRYTYNRPRMPSLNGKVERSHGKDEAGSYQLLTYTDDVDLSKKLSE